MPLDRSGLRRQWESARQGRNRRPWAQRDRLPVEAARRTDILDVARRLGLGEPERDGSEWCVRCPFHNDEDPSLRLNREKGAWYCWPCGEGGDVISLWMRATGTDDFPTAVKELTGGAR